MVMHENQMNLPVSEFWDNMNWSVTFKPDSDVYLPYYPIFKINKVGQPHLIIILKCSNKKTNKFKF